MEFKGKKIVLTGTFQSMKRSAVKKKLEALGAKVSSSVSKNTDVLIVGKEAGSKLEKARTLGISILLEADFLEVLELEDQVLIGPLSDFKVRFSALVKELEEHPNIEIKYYEMAKPASEEKIKEVEKYLEASLDPAIKNFYLQCDGVKLLWAYKDNERLEQLKLSASYNMNDGVLENSGICEGCINIFPILDTFLYNDWEGRIYFSEAAYMDQLQDFLGKPNLTKGDFSKRLRIFDYHHFFCQMAFYVEPGNGKPLVLMGDDHAACFTDSKVTNFESYINLVLANKGATIARSEFYGKYNGHQLGIVEIPKTHWTAENSFDLEKKT